MEYIDNSSILIKHMPWRLLKVQSQSQAMVVQKVEATQNNVQQSVEGLAAEVETLKNQRAENSATLEEHDDRIEKMRAEHETNTDLRMWFRWIITKPT